MEGNHFKHFENVEDYLRANAGRPTGETPNNFSVKSNIGITDFEVEDYARTLEKYVLIEEMIKRAGVLGKENEEKALREQLVSKPLQELMQDEIIEEAKEIATKSGREIDEEALRNELKSRTLQELRKTLKRLRDQQSNEMPSTIQQETKTTGEDREPGE